MNTCFSNIFRVILVSVAFLNFSSGIAQCAGTGTEITICNKETDPSLQTFNLFDELTGETPGGTWIAESNFNSDALDETTGILNLWEINRFGPHSFTYMNPACDTSTATIIINSGGYPGENNQNSGTNNVCQVLKTGDDDSANIIDLFIFIDTVNPMIEPDTGGMWTEDPSNMSLGVLGDEFFNFGNVPIGTYTFTYTIPAVNSCPERSATIDVEVRRSPVPGTPINLNICETDDMSVFTAVNLFSRLDDEDSNGEWTDTSTIVTGEISSGTDFEIDIQNIYNNFGPGTYSFTYEVLASHPICDEQKSTFIVCIEEQLVLNADVSVTCDGAVILVSQPPFLENGFYDLSYTVTGNDLGSYSNTKNISFQNGNAQFNLLPELSITTSETLTIQINDIVGPSACGGIPLCTSSVNVDPVDFDMFVEPSITVSSTSGCELDDVLITYMNVVDAAFAPIDGTIAVTYSINTVNFTDDVNFSNGNATSSVPVERFVQGGNQLVFFDTNSFVHCEDINRTTTLSLIPAPPNPVFSITPDDRCDAKNIQFGFDSPSGEFISYNPVTFDIYQFGSEPEQYDPRDPSVSLTNNTQGDGIDINLTNSNDVSSLPDGDYVFIVRSVQDDNAPCRGLGQTEIDNYAAQGIEIGLTLSGNEHIFDARLTFRIGEPEPAMLIKNTFEVCLLSGPVTLSDLSIFAGSDVDITVTDLAGTELLDTYDITEDEMFNAIFKSAITGCDLGSEQLAVTVVSEASTPVLNDNVFCSAATNIVADLDVSGQDIVWYDSETDGSVYNAPDVLDVNNEYWAEVTVSGGCVSTTRKQAVINFVNKSDNPTPLTNEFCSTASPTISDLKVESDPDATLQWYTSEIGEAYTSTSLPLDETKEYWVSQAVVEGCDSDRVQVTYTTTSVAMDPVPLANNFCTANGTVFTLEDLGFTDESISRQGDISYFSDVAGTTSISSTELLENVTSPVYVQQVIAGTCTSNIVEVNFMVEEEASAPVLNNNVFCSVATNKVSDLDVNGQDIVWYDAETDGTVYNAPEIIDTNNAYWAEVTIPGGCVSATRTQAVISFVDKANSPTPLTNEFCTSATPIISDLLVESSVAIKWYTSETGPAYSSTTLPLDATKEYWVSQVAAEGCESDRVQVTYTTTSNAMNPVPLANDFCTASGMVFDLEDLGFTDASISREGVISYFSDEAGTTSISSTELLENVTSPVYVQQVVASTCTSDIVAVNFTLQGVASKPTLTNATLCLQSNPTIQDLIDVLQSQTSTDITLFEDETTTTAIDVNIALNSISGDIYASQTITEGCGSTERTLVEFTFDDPTITDADFKEVHCSLGTPTLDDAYTGTENILWFDENDNSLLGSEILQNGVSYYAQLEVSTCLSSTFEVVITLINVTDPMPSSTDTNYCGIDEKVVSDLLEDEDGNMRFTIPTDYSLVWYDSNDVSTRNLLDNDAVLEQGMYYAVYEFSTTISGETYMCESNPVAISVDPTVCSTEELVIPDAFSPNGDKINDTFELQNIQFVYPDYTIEIYNRYGRVVFKGDVEVGFWDGKSNQSGLLSNDALPTGVYFYVIKFNRFGTEPYQGQVYLKR